MTWFASPAWGQEGTVTMTLDDWVAAGARPTAELRPPEGAMPIQRTLVGNLDRGLFVGTLTALFEVRARTVVPVLDGDSVVADARLDGAPVSVRLEGDQWVVDTLPGRHELVLSLLHGEQTERFTRALQLDLPAGGPTALNVTIPEGSIEPTLRGGVVSSAVSDGNATQLRGWLDATGRVDLSWEQESDPAAAGGPVRFEAAVGSVLSVGEDVVVGVARYQLDVREGELDRFELSLPVDVEVLDVTGSQVLQWHTDAGGRLVVLLKNTEDESADATVRFQYPVPPDEPVPLRVPVPPAAVALTGAVGVEAPVGIDVAPQASVGTTLLEPRDIPRSVLDLTREPLRGVWSFEQAPDATVAVKRRDNVEVSSSRIDDLQGITVLVEDGTEVGKLLLQVRNTTRQVLVVDLPEGARLTHCFRDGVPLRPGAVAGVPERVLVPLTRSATSTTTVHVVEPGDMLSGLALRYYGDASAWPRIADANPGAGSGLAVGAELQIPPREASVEQAFALELGWERASAPLGPIGSRRVTLPRLDLDVMAANWHLYLPETVEPLTVTGAGPVGLVDRLHADPLARVWAAAFAGDSYSSVLGNRRKMFAEEERKAAETGADPFPLVGRRFRLRGVFLGTEPATVDLRWVTTPIAVLVRLLASATAAMGAVVLTRTRGPSAMIGAALASFVALLVAHHVLGVHRALVWGADAGLFLEFALAWLAGRRWTWGRPSPLTVVLAGTFVIGSLCFGDLLPVWVGLALVAVRWRMT